MDSKQLCLKLLAAESEAEVQAIIDKTPEMLDPQNWFPIDGRDTNFNIVTNQAMSGGKAATELMTNMVDAMLMKHAYLKKIDPRSKDDNVPQTMYDAVDKLISNMHGGKLVNEDESWLKDFSSQNLIIGVTGKRSGGEPCFTFADNGEGQNPDKFEDTFLSLSKGNKRDIPFVQGKYNMGSSGVLSYCGECWFKLIISRRFDMSDEWGWTLIRKRPGASIPIADYFKIDSAIPSFGVDKIYPFNKNSGDRFDHFSLNSGTIIKLYDFFLGNRHTGFLGTREAFNENLTETILPFRIYDFRYPSNYNKGSLRAEGVDERPFYGMEYSLLRLRQESAEDESNSGDLEIAKEHSISEIMDPTLGKIHITAIESDKLPSWLGTKSINRVFHAVNGQVQFKQTRGHLTDCGYPALKDRVVVIVDASDLKHEAHNNIWKGDREHIRETQAGAHYSSVIRKALENSDKLKELQDRAARKELSSISKKESADIFQKLVDNDPNLAKLLDDRNPSIILKQLETNDEKDEYEGNYSPTIFELEEKFRSKDIEITVSRGRPIAAKTDVINDYFHRADNRGHLFISPNEVERYFSISQSLKDSRLTMYFSPVIKTDIVPGMKFSFDIGLYDPTMPNPLTTPITIVVVEESILSKPSKENTSEKRQKENEKPKKGLPIYKLLTKNGREILGEPTECWPSDFSDYDGGIVKDLGQEMGKLYKINYDNAYHLKYRQAQKGEVEKDALTQKYILGMRLLMLGFEHAIRNSQDKSLSDFIDQFRQIAAKGAASTVLALVEVLPKFGGVQDNESE